jgi:outer membrane protein TolC
MSREGLSFGADNTITATANLTIPLFAPAVYASLKLNRTQMEAAVEAARSSKINLVSEVKKTYYGILLAEQSLEVLLASEETIKQTVDNTQAMFDSGLASEYDLLTAEVQLSNLQPTIIQTRNSINISKMLLRMYLSIPQEVQVNVNGTLDSYTDMVVNVRKNYVTDISDNSELRNLDIQERMLQQQVKLLNTQRMPTIAAFGSVTLTGNDMGSINFMSSMGDTPDINPGDYPNLSLGQLTDIGKYLGNLMGGGKSNAPAPTGFWWQNPVTLGVQMSIPIFAGNTNVNRVRQTRNSLAQLDIQRDYLMESITMQMQSSLNNIMAAREKVSANQKTVAQAQKAYDISESRYNAGAGTILELNSAHLALTQAQLNHSQAIYDFLAAEAEHVRVIGKEYIPAN